ncbi:neutral zinc metallopeptidase [Saccharomonospora xinjiangensis]|uniref:Putative metalloprotease n=1 Tax=Saccharomonospora xinjiangensis XJ-54 TaxID=882086 RepID=I0UZ95_9PSEU|nr:neutral zinc metallopeptidase [Saccharomonospora xinjiangensis]EID53198.1 putative metalloprotease [Saccharomonospora xinjiangensis XJ-54]
MHTVGDAAGDPAREPGPVRPYLEDLPLELWDSDDTAESRPASTRRSRWRAALPVAVALALACVFVAVLPSLGEPDQAQPAAPVSGDSVPSLASIGDNRLLRSGTELADVRCELPPLRGEQERLHAFYTAELRCLERAWKPALARSGVPFAPVVVNITDDPVTACGELPPADQATGLYCAEDATIYLPRARTLEAFGLTEEAHIATLAHEYGHHVQHLSGILADANRQLSRYPSGSPPDRELGRRVELQANCFAGAFLASASGRGSITDDLGDAAVNDFRNWVDSETHGTSETQRKWAARGFRDGDMGQCNTWYAPSEDVA